VLFEIPGPKNFSAMLRASQMVVSLWCENRITFQAPSLLAYLLSLCTLIPLVADIITILLYLVSL
jgi:hypothetical protein